MGIYQNFEYTQWQTEQKESARNFSFLLPETYPDDEGENVPERTVSDNRLWGFVDRSGKSAALSPFVPVPLEVKNECASLSSHAPEFDPKKAKDYGGVGYSQYKGSLFNYMPSLSTSNAQQNEYLTGKLKFFDEAQQYGFFVLDRDGTDLFVHQDDLEKSGITIESLQRNKEVRFVFECMTYYGKYQLSRKAVNIKVIAKEVLKELRCN
eukprot:TRINITY_DN7815_c0_g2_i10.p2 TRINITY_DN7815_c0_g2~~TRINITY_DN7815_c0_g2_i10.p2  ORF type:complete len:209 (-),score=62.31 TRINITY_DN7815_c0_g2_i10:170-796(-)